MTKFEIAKKLQLSRFKNVGNILLYNRKNLEFKKNKTHGDINFIIN